MTAALLTCLALAVPCSHREGTRHPITPQPRGGPALVETPIETGQRLAQRAGWMGREWACLATLGNRESGWTVEKWNRAGSGAYGVGQALPASKMAAYGADYMTSARTQILWFLAYVKARYGTPCNALAHSFAAGWY